MRSGDHERIAEAVASTNPQYFAPSILSRLKEGSTWPDRVQTRRAHHTDRQRDIMHYILAARKYFLQDNFTESAFYLGIAFHYIADGTCPASTDPSHNSWEREIGRLPLPRRLFSASFSTPNQLFNHIEHELGVKRKTENSSFYTTLSICSGIPTLVWRAVENKNNLEEELINRAKSELPNKLSYNLSIIIIFVALALNVFLVPILDLFQILLSLIATGVVSSIPFRRFYKRRQAVIWVLDWYGLHY
jgi:Zinc dependent phospholipase C